jgi:uncharacterized protein YicC (UPF0701 family)
MKTYPFEFEGQTYRLKKLDQEVKEEVLDFIVAGRLRQLGRLLKKKLLSPAEYLEAKQGAAVKWGSEAWVMEIADEENAKHFLKHLVIEEVDDDTLGAMVAAQREEGSALGQAIKDNVEDSQVPKARTPRPSMD